MKKRFKKWIYRYLLPYIGLMLVRLISMTYRIRLVDRHREQRALGTIGKVAYCSWHQRFFPGITFFSSRKPIAIMISRSNDGEMAARAVKALGWYPVRGSSTRGGKEALAKVKELARSGFKIGHIVDGPQGPFGKVKPGLIRIAQAGGMPILPTITSAQNRWVFNSWDRFMVPKPFSRVIIRFGEPIEVPQKLDAEAFEQLRLKIERQLENDYRKTDAIWSDPDRIRQIYS